jgi:hypothetical protein
MHNIRPLNIAYTVNLGPQAINRDCYDKNNQSGARKHSDIQIIFQPEGMNPAF